MADTGVLDDDRDVFAIESSGYSDATAFNLRTDAMLHRIFDQRLKYHRRNLQRPCLRADIEGIRQPFIESRFLDFEIRLYEMQLIVERNPLRARGLQRVAKNISELFDHSLCL